MLGVVAVVSAVGRWETCHTELPSIGVKATVKVCDPVAVMDVPFLAVVALALLLLAPDITEFGLPGGFSVKRRLQEQEAKSMRQETRQDALEQRVDLVQQQVQAQTAVAAVNNTIVVDSDRVRTSTDEKTAAFEASETAEGSEEPAERGEERERDDGVEEEQTQRRDLGDLSRAWIAEPPNSERAQQEIELLQLWAQLERWVLVADAWRANRRSKVGVWPPTVGWALGLEPSKLDDILRWRGIFAEELDFVRATRNSIAHRIPVSDHDLDNALLAARRLMEIPAAQFEPHAGDRRRAE